MMTRNARHQSYLLRISPLFFVKAGKAGYRICTMNEKAGKFTRRIRFFRISLQVGILRCALIDPHYTPSWENSGICETPFADSARGLLMFVPKEIVPHAGSRTLLFY